MFERRLNYQTPSSYLANYNFTWHIGFVIKSLLDFDSSSSVLNLSMKVATATSSSFKWTKGTRNVAKD